MRPTPFRLLAGRSATYAAMLITVSTAIAQRERVQQGVQTAGSAVAQGASLLGGALPGGAVISSAVASLTPVADGGATSASYVASGRMAPAPAATCPVAEDGTFSFKGLKPGAYEFRISFPAGPRQTTDTSSSKQTQGATFDGKVNAGLATAGNAKTKHDTAKNSIGNIRAHEEAQNGGVSVAAGDVTGDGRAESARAAASSVSGVAGAAGGGAAAASYAKENINSGMPNRISMNVTVPKQNFTIVAGGDPVAVQVGPDGSFAGRASVNQQQQGAEPALSERRPPKSEPPPRPAGG